VTNHEERRESKRETYHTALSLQIVFASVAPSLLGKKLDGETIDISAKGLCIALNYAIPVDCTLDVWVTLKDSSKKYFLSGKVRWTKPIGNQGKFASGIYLFERTDTKTDLNDWKKILNER